MSDNRFKSFDAMFSLESNMEITMLKINQLCIIKDQKWSVYGGDKLRGLQDSIAEWGILEPLIVRPAEDVPYPIDGKYQIISGRHRFWAAEQNGHDELPCIIKRKLSEDEMQIIMDETNLYQRGWADMKPSERAAVIATHYYATQNHGKRADFIAQISAEIKTLANAVNSRAESGLSHDETSTNLRDAAADFNMSKDTIARYLRVDVLEDSLKAILDVGKLSLVVAVELSYLYPDHQDYIADALEQNPGTKVDIKKAEMLRAYESKGNLDEVTIAEILIGKKKTKPVGRPKAFKLQPKIVYKYFDNDAKQKDIEETIDKALEMYFQTVQ